MKKKSAAAPIVATVIEKTLSTRLYWKMDKSGIAAKNATESIMSNPFELVTFPKVLNEHRKFVVQTKLPKLSHYVV